MCDVLTRYYLFKKLNKIKNKFKPHILKLLSQKHEKIFNFISSMPKYKKSINAFNAYNYRNS